MTRALLGVVLLTSLLAPAAATGAHRATYDPNSSYTFRSLNNPTSGDAFGFRAAIQQNAQGLSNKLFGSLASLLGGTAPALNFVPAGSPLLVTGDSSANLIDTPGGPKGTINVSPIAVEALTNFKSPYHDPGVTAYPHEMAHLRQTTPTLADLMRREGGAQAFSDIVTPAAAKRAGIPYAPGDYDPPQYASLVKGAQALGRDWLLAGQFGKSGSPNWP